MRRWSVLVCVVAFGPSCAIAEVEDDIIERPAAEPSYEVWLVDQSATAAGPSGFGGRIHIYASDQLAGADAAEAVPETIALEGATTALCIARTGAAPARPRTLAFNSTGSHAILAFLASGHVVIYNAATRQPVACIRSAPGDEGARQARAAIPTVDDDYIVVANSAGKLLERINSDYATETFIHDPAATVPLFICGTPSGLPCEFVGRPNVAPISPVPLPDGKVALTLTGGGLFVVDPSTEPMQIVTDYDNNAIAAVGAGGAVIRDRLFVTSGGGTAAQPSGYNVYSLPATGYAPTGSLNTPSPVVVEHDADPLRDAQGVAGVKSSRGNYAWVVDRGLGRITPYDAATYAEMPAIAIATSAPITPDQIAVSPNGNRVFTSLRGPIVVGPGAVPGLAVVRVGMRGAGGQLQTIVPITNVAGDTEFADAYGLGIRRN